MQSRRLLPVSLLSSSTMNQGYKEMQGYICAAIKEKVNQIISLSMFWIYTQCHQMKLINTCSTAQKRLNMKV